MDRLTFDDYKEFVSIVSDAYNLIREDDDLNDTAIIAKYEDTRHIIQELICLGYSIQNIDIKSPEWEYDDEYVITLCNVDGGDIWCEPMIKNGDYLEDESSIIYVLDNCSSEVLNHLDSKCIFEVGIGDDECDCDECECACKKDEEPVTTSTSNSTYKINNKEVTKEEFDAAMSEIKDKYLDNVRDMLLGYCDVMDRMNQWRSRLFW